MKLKLAEIVESVDGIKELSALKLPAKTAYQIARNMKLINAELDEFNKARSSLITDKYGVRSEDGDSFQVPPKNVEKFTKEMTDLLNMEINLDIYPVELTDEVLLSADTMYRISWMFVNYNQEEKKGININD